MINSKNGTVVTLLSMQFPLWEFKSGQIRPPGFDFIRVVDTDYQNYILWHACLNDPITGEKYERVDFATRGFEEISAYGQYDFNRIIAEKIYYNDMDFDILPYGRCNCLYI